MTRLYGRISTPLMAGLGVESWILSLRDSRASRSLLLVSGVASKTQGTSGPTWHESFGSVSRRSSSLRTYRDSLRPSLLTGDLPTNWSKTTYKAWVSELRAVSLQRRKSAQPTGGNASSSWPTPDANVMNDGESPMTFMARRAALPLHSHCGASPSVPLSVASQMGPTPVTDDADNSTRASGEFQSLTREVARQWGTPSSREWKGAYSEKALTRKDGKSRMDLLGNQAVYWATPVATDAEKMPSGSLARQVAPDLALSKRKGEEEKVSPFSPQALQIPDGEASSFQDRTSPPPSAWPRSMNSDLPSRSLAKRLNPRFVEWMMGWEAGWTSLAPLGFDSLATASCQHKQPMPFGHCGPMCSMSEHENQNGV